MATERSCFNCKHLDCWTEYGNDLTDCRLATLDSQAMRDNRVSKEDYEKKHAVYLTVVDLAGDFEDTATYCPNFDQEVHC